MPLLVLDHLGPLFSLWMRARGEELNTWMILAQLHTHPLATASHVVNSVSVVSGKPGRQGNTGHLWVRGHQPRSPIYLPSSHVHFSHSRGWMTVLVTPPCLLPSRKAPMGCTASDQGAEWGQMGTGEVKSQVRMSGHTTCCRTELGRASEDPPGGTHCGCAAEPVPPREKWVHVEPTEQATGRAVWLSPWDTKTP